MVRGSVTSPDDSDDFSEPASSTYCSTADSAPSARRSFTRGEVKSHVSNSVAPDLGTAYGKAEAYYTQSTEFERATATPALVLQVRYGVTAKLREWGVPVDVAAPVAPPMPEAFPASPGYAQPPAGWRG